MGSLVVGLNCDLNVGHGPDRGFTVDVVAPDVDLLQALAGAS